MNGWSLVAAVGVGCAAPAPEQPVVREPLDHPQRGARRGTRIPTLEVLGAGRVVALVPTDDGLELRADGPGGALRWRIDGRDLSVGEAGAPCPAVVRREGGWRVGAVELPVRCAVEVRGPGAVVARGGGVVLDPCDGALMRWGDGWRVTVTIGEVGPGAWLVGDGEEVGVVRGGPTGLQWQSWSILELTPVGAVALPLPGGERVVAQGLERRAAPAGATLDVSLPEGLRVVDVAMVDGALIVAGGLDVGGVEHVALARVGGL